MNEQLEPVKQVEAALLVPHPEQEQAPAEKPVILSGIWNPIRRFQILLIAAAAVWLAGEIAARFGLCISPLYVVYHNLPVHQLNTLAGTGLFILFLLSKPSMRTLGYTCLLAAFLTPLFWGLIRPPLFAHPLAPVNSVFYALGLAALAELCWRAWVNTGV